MQNQLEKAINLCKKTGDRLIVFDNVRSENPFVVMNLDDYEKIVSGKSEVRGLTEEELLDKINRDIAIWKSDQTELGLMNQKPDLSQNFAEETVETEEPIRTIIPEQPMAYQQTSEPTNQPEDDPSADSGQDHKRSNHWAIRNEVKEAAEEIVEEEPQRLETITY